MQGGDVKGRALLACAAALLLSGCHNGGGAIGDACKADGDCNSLSCKTEAAAGYPGGMCTDVCSSKACPSGSLCSQLSGQSLCAKSCTQDSDCRTGYSCCASLGNVCLPPAMCSAAVCLRPVVPSSLSAPQLIAFGPQAVGNKLSFNVPANTGSITIVQQAISAGLNITYQGSVLDNSAVPDQLRFPDGGLAYDDINQSDPASPDGGVEPANHYAYFGGGTPSTGTFTIPNTSTSVAAGVPSGNNWSFLVNDYAFECTKISGCSSGTSSADTYDVSVLLRPLPQGSNLDVNFYIVANATNSTGQPFTAANAPADLAVKRMLKTFGSLYLAAGINLRIVNFYDTSAADRSRFGTHINADKIGPCDELDQMMLLSAAHPGNTMNLFLVQSITSNSPSQGGTIVGIDGTIPGPSSYSGTVHSGAAVSLADLFQGVCGPNTDPSNCGADAVAYISAHETGHFLGLFHTTELTGDYFDPIADTAKCPCLSCATTSDLPNCQKHTSSSPTLSADRCNGSPPNCGGADNLMFWQLYSTNISKGKLTAQQAAVMQLNPLVQ
jgi:hypothetical protein